MHLAPLNTILIEPLLRGALAEDLGRNGDITSNSIIPAKQVWKGSLVARQPGMIAGLDIARLTFQLIDPAIKFDAKTVDGACGRTKDYFGENKW